MKTVIYEIIMALPITVLISREGSDFADSISPQNLAEWMKKTALAHKEAGEDAVFKFDTD